MIGNHQWILLPLLPSLREPGAEWQEEAYYIYQREGTSQKFPGVWKLDHHSGNAPRSRAGKSAAAEQMLE